MGFVNAKCTNCGGNLMVNDAKEAWVCSHCGSPFVVERAINNYCITNNIHADVVNINARQNFEIRAGVLIKYHGADVDVVVPNNVMVIGDCAFRDCAYLSSVLLPVNLRHIGYGAFSGCKSITEIIIPDNVESIGEWAFEGCQRLRKVSLSQGMNRIEERTFKGCSSLSMISIPSKINFIGKSAFENCVSLKSIVLPTGLTCLQSGYREDRYYRDSCYPPQYGGIFNGCSMLEEITIPDTVVDIEQETFRGCKKLVRVNYNGIVSSAAFEGAPFIAEYQRWLYKQGRCPACARVLTVIFKNCPQKYCGFNRRRSMYNYKSY